MKGRSMQAARCPTDELSLTNCAVVNEKDFQAVQKCEPNEAYIYIILTTHK
uniref:Uncharacterized protein n=1 Tax=Chelonoidis abingdonii TaxID=106734 RepID=A0A8C0GAN7_CHEAB